MGYQSSLKYLEFVLIEAKDAARAAQLMKSVKVKHDNVSSISPEVQHQVQNLNSRVFELEILFLHHQYVSLSHISGVAECFGDI